MPFGSHVTEMHFGRLCLYLLICGNHLSLWWNKLSGNTLVYKRKCIKNQFTLQNCFRVYDMYETILRPNGHDLVNCDHCHSTRQTTFRWDVRNHISLWESFWLTFVNFLLIGVQQLMKHELLGSLLHLSALKDVTERLLQCIEFYLKWLKSLSTRNFLPIFSLKDWLKHKHGQWSRAGALSSSFVY